jgi:hypothetical protein
MRVPLALAQPLKVGSCSYEFQDQYTVSLNVRVQRNF